MKTVQRVTSIPVLPPRAVDAHKGSFGRVLVVGGCRRMSGAVAMATMSALRGGAGLAEFACPASVQPIVAGVVTCAVSMPLSCDAAGDIAPSAVAEVAERARAADVIAVGPGFDVGIVQQQVIRLLLEQEKPLVIDADGLNNLGKIDGWASLRRCPLILTPHPGEFSRLTGKPMAEIQSNREEMAVAAVREWAEQCGTGILPVSDAGVPPARGGSILPPRSGQTAGKMPAARTAGTAMPPSTPPLVLVLKGSGTVVTDGSRIYVNTTGNPGMATGGSGDILTGLTAALVGQHLTPFDAACLAVYCHGRAGDLAAAKLGQPSLIATDLLDYLPQAIQEVIGQR